MNRITALLAALLFIAIVSLSACARPWSHADYSGAEADKMFKKDSLHCQVVAGKEYPLDEIKQNQVYDACMNDLGWDHHPEGKGIRFQTRGK